MDLSSLLSNTLTAQGYEVEDAPPLDGRSGATYPVSLIATDDGDRFLVDVLADRPVMTKDLEALDAIVEDTGLDGAILFALGGLDTDPTGDQAPDRIQVRTRDAVEKAIGERVLAHATQADDDPEAIGPSPVDLEAIDWQPPTEPDAATSPAAADRANGSAANGGTHRTGTPPSEATSPSTGGDDPIPDDGGAELLTSDETPNDAPSPEPPTQDAPPPSEDPATASTEPEPEPPGADPEPAASTEEPQAATGGTESEADETFVSPEEMAERAKEMLEQGEIPDDGDAELITDDDPAQTPEASRSPPPQQGDAEPSSPTAGHDDAGQPGPGAAPDATDPEPSRELPSTDPEDERPPEPEPEGQVFEEGDCELLPSKPRPEATDEPQGSTATEDPSSTGMPTAAEEPDPASSSAPPAEDATGSAPSPASQDAPATSSPAAAAGPTDPGTDEAFLSGGCLAPRIDEADARHEAEGALFRVESARLELLPFHVFDYACVLDGDGTRKEADGRVWVSAQSGAVVEDPEGDLVEDPGIPNERFQGSLSAGKAARDARSHLLDNLERREELKEDYSETAIIERVTLTPQEDTLELSHLGTALAPRWRVEGQNGTVFVDAVSGEMISG